MSNKSGGNATSAIIIQNNTSNALGIASFVFGLLSIFILALVFAPLALILGIIAIIKKQLVWGILGIACSVIGMMVSPSFWMIFSSIGIATGS